MIISFLFNLSIYPGLLKIRPQTWHPWRQISAWVFASLMVPCTKFDIPSNHDTSSNFCFINFNIITRNYGLNKTTLILVVAFQSVYYLVGWIKRSLPHSTPIYIYIEILKGRTVCLYCISWDIWPACITVQLQFLRFVLIVVVVAEYVD